jgi:AMMECR1 domain-containing protein
MNRYRPTLLQRKDSISTRWVRSQEDARDNGGSSEHRPSTITLPSAPVSQSPKQAAAQAAALKTRFPDLDNDELNELIDQFK